MPNQDDPNSDNGILSTPGGTMGGGYAPGYWDGRGWVYPWDSNYDPQKDVGSGGGGGGTPNTSNPTPYDPANPTGAIPPDYSGGPVGGATPGGGAGGLGSFLPQDANGWLRFISTLYGIYGASRGSHFHQAPDPLTDMLRARMYGFIDNSPTRNMLGSALQNYVSAGNNQQMPNMPDKYGYNPYPNGVPKYDLSAMIPWIQQSMHPNAQQPNTPQTPPPPDYTTPNTLPTSRV